MCSNRLSFAFRCLFSCLGRQERELDPSTNKEKLETSNAKSCWQERARNSVLHTEPAVFIGSLAREKISNVEICQQEGARDSAPSLYTDPAVGFINASTAGFSAVSTFVSALFNPFFCILRRRHFRLFCLLRLHLPHDLRSSSLSSSKTAEAAAAAADVGWQLPRRLS